MDNRFLYINRGLGATFPFRWFAPPEIAKITLVRSGLVYDIVLGVQLLLLLAAALGVGIARYYVLVTWATVVSLVRYLRFGVPAVWAKAEGTR